MTPGSWSAVNVNAWNNEISNGEIKQDLLATVSECDDSLL